MADQEIRVLIADDHGDPLVRFFHQNGIRVHRARSWDELMAELQFWEPHFLIIDDLFPDAPAVKVLRTFQSDARLSFRKTKVFVISQHGYEENVKQCLKLGASDFLVRPYIPEDVFSRLIMHTQAREPSELSTQEIHEGQQNYFLHLTQLALKKMLEDQEAHSSLFHLTQMVALSLKAVRVSIIHCRMSRREGVVLATHDDPNLHGLILDLQKYPEVQFVMIEKKLLAMDNLKTNPRMAPLLDALKSVRFNSIIVCPIFQGIRPVGVLSIRMPDHKLRISDEEIRYAQVMAHIAGFVLRIFPEAVPGAPSEKERAS